MVPRQQRLYLRLIARLLKSPFSTAARTLSRHGLWRLRNLDPKAAVQRYAWDRQGDLIHIDVKSLPRFRKVVHRITGDRQQGRSYGVGYDKNLVAVDGATNLAVAPRGAPAEHIEMLVDEQKPTVIGLLRLAVAWFSRQRIECRRVMRENGPATITKALNKAYYILALRHIRSRAYTARTNGKAERFMNTLQGMGLRYGLADIIVREPLASSLSEAL